MEIRIEPEFASRNPGYGIVLIEADVKVDDTTEEQKNEMNALAERIASTVAIGEINQIPAIAATRAAYKRCGKDPNRYRPSQEQLMRRIVRGLGLYNVNSLVDAGNELSLLTGCSVGCFDADKIKGETLTVGIGKEGEPYEGIGRGVLNIAGMPVVRDEAGGIGTPTSDNERTKITPDTNRLVMTIHVFDDTADIDKIQQTAVDLLQRFASALSIRKRAEVLSNVMPGRQK